MLVILKRNTLLNRSKRIKPTSAGTTGSMWDPSCPLLGVQPGIERHGKLLVLTKPFDVRGSATWAGVGELWGLDDE